MTWSASYVIEQLINGVVLGSIYSLLAIGFSMIYGVLGLVNFAHGDVTTIGAFVALGLLVAWHWPFAGVLVAIAAVGAMVGIAIERVAFRPVRQAPQVTGFITSLAVSILLQNLGILLLSPQPRTFRLPSWLTEVTPVGAAVVRHVDILIVVLSTAALLALAFFVNRTRAGMAIRAVAANPPVAALMGIHVDRVVVLTFALGSALATVAGLMWAGRIGQIDPLMGVMPGLKSFVAAVIGGVGSIPGAVVGGYVLGLAEVLFVGLLPPAMASFRDAFVFALLLALLIVRPEGLFGREVA